MGIELTPKTIDGGYDIYAVANLMPSDIDTVFLVECKRYQPENKIGVEIVRSVYGAKSEFQGAHAILATTSFFTRPAKKFKSSRYDLHFKDYNGVLEWLEQYKPNPYGTINLS